MRCRSILLVTLVAAVAACSDFPEREALDATPIYGCYIASGSPTFIVKSTGVRIAGAKKTIPFRYEMHKIGAVLKIPIEADVVGGKNIFQQSDDHFYRVIFSGGQPIIRVAFGKEGYLSDYVRYPANDCEM